VLKGAWFAPFYILALFTFAKISTVNTLLVAFTVLLLAVTLPAVASFEMPFFLITNS
jgi:hypothetical protein